MVFYRFTSVYIFSKPRAKVEIEIEIYKVVEVGLDLNLPLFLIRTLLTSLFLLIGGKL